MLEWCRISYINRVREDTDETQNYVLWHAAKKEWGGCREHAARTPDGKQQTHICTQQADQSAAQHNKSKPSPAQPSQPKQTRSSAKTSQVCEQALQNTCGQKSQSIKLAFQIWHHLAHNTVHPERCRYSSPRSTIHPHRGQRSCQWSLQLKCRTATLGTSAYQSDGSRMFVVAFLNPKH